MSQDSPDTIMIQEASRWETTQVEDVFLPSVRVQLAWTDIEEAVSNGAIVPAEAHSLWATWAMPGAPTRLASSVGARATTTSRADAAAEGWADTRQMAADASTGEPLDLTLPYQGEGQGLQPKVAGVAGLVVGVVLGAALTWLALG